MFRLDPGCYLQLWVPVDEEYFAMVEIDNTLSESLSLDSDFLYGIAKQAWEDETTEYEFEVPITISFERV